MIRRVLVLAFCLALVWLCLFPAFAAADGEQKVIRVGWYETPFNHMDSFGRRTGYAYEYQRKIAAYTGWKYEYVEGSWPELLQMLEDGRIDLMSDVSWTPERAEKMLYSSIPMGNEFYYLYVSADRADITPDNYASLNGKKVGVTRGTVQRDLFLQWVETHGITVVLEELDGSEAESLGLLTKGDIDAFVSLDTYGDPEKVIPIWKIGDSSFYFALNRDRMDLLAELDAAMNRILEENKHYSEQLSAKYLQSSGINRYLTADEREWLEEHGKIRVGYQDNYLAFCAKDPETGELTGALKDYLEYASGVLDNAKAEFEAIAYPTAAETLEALKRGEVDCMFPANLTDYDGEQAGVVMTASLMRTEMDAVVRAEDRQDFLRKKNVRVAVNRGNPNYEMFLLDHFPEWTPVICDDTPSCLEKVAEKGADCIIISNYRYRDISRQCEKLGLTTVYIGVDMDYCFAVKEGDTTLYSILSRIIGEVPDSAVNASLTYYSAEPTGSPIREIFLDYPYAVIAAGIFAVVLAVFAVRGFLLTQKNKPGK